MSYYFHIHRNAKQLVKRNQNQRGLLLKIKTRKTHLKFLKDKKGEKLKKERNNKAVVHQELLSKIFLTLMTLILMIQKIQMNMKMLKIELRMLILQKSKLRKRLKKRKKVKKNV